MTGLYDKLDELMNEINNIRDKILILEDEILNTDIPEEKQNNIAGSLVVAINYLNDAYYSSNDALNIMEEFYDE